MVLVSTFAMAMLSACTEDRLKRAEVAPVQTISDARLVNIDSIVLDKMNRIFVSDIHSVKVFSADGSLLNVIGEQGAGDGQFVNEVIGLAINSNEELYAVDQDQSRIQVFDLEGNHLRSFGQKGEGDGQFLVPQGIAVDSKDLVYVTDMGRSDLQVFSRNGEFLYQIARAGDGAAELKEPESMAIRDEQLFVADEGHFRIQIFGMRGEHQGHLPRSGAFALGKEMESDLDDMPSYSEVDKRYERFYDSDIEGIAFDDRGVLYALNEDAGEVMVMRDQAQIGVFTSTIPITSGDGMAFDADFERLYIVDQSNATIQVFDTAEIYRLLGL